MNYDYHIALIKKSKNNNDRFKGDPIYDQLIGTYDSSGVDGAMKSLVNGTISISEYVDRISVYDELIVGFHRKKPQKSNPVNTGQNKVYSTWREQKWAPVVERIRRELQKRTEQDLKLVQNSSVAQIIYEDGTAKSKDVDCGIAIESSLESSLGDKKILIPVLVSEDKGGHACATCFDGVAGVAGHFKQSFPLSRSVFITDNNVSIGQDKSASIFQDINMVICERGDNSKGLKSNQYIPLKGERWQALYDAADRYFTPEILSRLSNYTASPVRASGKFREQIDRTGLFVNF
jgi:hypothetical protein